MNLTIELDGVKGEVEVDFDQDDNGVYIEHYAASHAWSEFADYMNECVESDIETAIWAAYDAYIKDANAP